MLFNFSMMVSERVKFPPVHIAANLVSRVLRFFDQQLGFQESKKFNFSDWLSFNGLYCFTASLRASSLLFSPPAPHPQESLLAGYFTAEILGRKNSSATESLLSLILRRSRSLAATHSVWPQATWTVRETG